MRFMMRSIASITLYTASFFKAYKGKVIYNGALDWSEPKGQIMHNMIRIYMKWGYILNTINFNTWLATDRIFMTDLDHPASRIFGLLRLLRLTMQMNMVVMIISRMVSIITAIICIWHYCRSLLQVPFERVEDDSVTFWRVSV